MWLILDWPEAVSCRENFSLNWAVMISIGFACAKKCSGWVALRRLEVW